LLAARRQLVADAPQLRVLLLGEFHTSRDAAARQGALDRYSAGRTDEAGLLREVGWSEVWNHDPELYLPLLRWARRQAVPLLALNVEPAVAQRVRQQGLARVPPSAREGIGLPAPVGPAYRQRLTAAWQGHQSGAAISDPAAAADLERFIDSQRLRDRAMAERLTAAGRREPGRLLVALVGRGHMEGDDGVVLVRQVAPGSAAAAAGIRPGDRVVQVNGEPMERAGQVIRRVAAQAAGEPLRLTLEREGRSLELTVPLAPASGDNGRHLPLAS
jgi:uncharacterized iron-regulated protein